MKYFLTNVRNGVQGLYLGAGEGDYVMKCYRDKEGSWRHAALPFTIEPGLLQEGSGEITEGEAAMIMFGAQR